MPLNSTNEDRDLLVDAVRIAAPVAMAAFVPGGAARGTAWEKENNLGLVTETDLAVNQRLRDVLMEARPEYGWLSEEDADDLARQDTPRQFIVDPIDGTRSFAEGKPEFCLSVAVAEAGRVVAAAIFAPAKEALFDAADTAGARLNGTAITVSDQRNADAARILGTRSIRTTADWSGGVPGFEIGYVHPIAYRLCLVASGEWDGLITFRGTNEWDVAAGDLIVREAGGQVTDQRGRVFEFNKSTPRVPGALAGSHALHADLRRRLPDAPEIARG